MKLVRNFLLAAVGLALLVPSGARAETDFHFEESFETAVSEWSAHWLRNEIGSHNRIVRTENGYAGRGIQVTIPRGQHKGSEMILPSEVFGAKDAEIAASTLRIRIDTPFAVESQGKIPGFVGPMAVGGQGGNSCQDEVCWSGRGFYTACRNQRVEECPTYQFGVYMYGPHQTNDTGDFFFADSSLQLEPGKWHCLQTFVKMNEPGESNGIFMAFIDGQIEKGVTVYTMFRQAGDQSGIRGFWLNFYEGGKEPAKTEMKISFDELQISRQLIPQEGCLQEVPELLAEEISLSPPPPAAPPTTVAETPTGDPKFGTEAWLYWFVTEVILPLIGFPFVRS